MRRRSRLGVVPRQHAHFLYGFFQSGVTTAVASAVANLRFFADGAFVINWLEAWLASWALMVPIVLFAAPLIQRATLLLTRD
jgi:uncharacterized membrane protein